MRWPVKLLLGLVVLSGAVALGGYWYLATYDDREPSRLAYLEYCAGCHGDTLLGTASGPALTGELALGDAAEQLILGIRQHHGDLITQAELPAPMVKALALYISEQRQQMPTILGSHDHQVPTDVVYTDLHNFQVELIEELDSGPYSMAPLPDGRILVVEKVRGLSVLSGADETPVRVTGTPKVWSEIVQVRGSYVGIGMMLDVELHPDYVSNGWIYLSHSDRCQLDCGSPWPVSMVRVIRGRLQGSAWVDTEVIWSVHHDHYTVVPDGVAAGRLAFDQAGYLYVTVGGKSTYDNLHVLDTPYGKIHRVHDDGRIPSDNPFWQADHEREPASTRHTVWSYGHRTTQGLTADPVSGDIWSTEMGPRGGDEINLIQRGGNYGWPLYTNGLGYDAEPIRIGEDLGLDFALADTIAPVVDFTPAPSLSNFTFHHGDQFPHWQNDLLVGSLRAQTLFRIRIAQGQVMQIEKLLTKLGRIRDVEMGPDGLVYVLLEHHESGSLVRLVPVLDQS